MRFQQERREYQQAICRRILSYQAGIPSHADRRNKTSVQIAERMLDILQMALNPLPPADQTARREFVSVTRDYLEATLHQVAASPARQWLSSIRGDRVVFSCGRDLLRLEKVLAEHPQTADALGEYAVTPDLLIGYKVAPPQGLSPRARIDGSDAAFGTSDQQKTRTASGPVLRASISCNWRLCRAGPQGITGAGLNLVRSRTGRVPYIAVVTAEPLPTRIASIALGTGDLDCVYHFALPEMQGAIEEIDNQDQKDMLETLVQGRRLRDISDLPFDLAT